MDGGQSSRQAGADASSNKANETLDEKMKKIEMKPPAAAVGLLARNAALLPSGIVRVKQLKEVALPPTAQGSISSGSATGNPRNKTALAPGHSLMDWIRLGNSGVDLTGVGGQLQVVTPTELARHDKENDAWIAIRGVVYNVTRYMSFHPGGIPELMRGVGKDATKLFDDVHAWVNYQSILQKCVVGRFERLQNIELFLENDKPEKSKPASPAVAGVKMDWRQTSSSLSLFYSDPRIGECRMKKLDGQDLELRIQLDEADETVTHRVSLAEPVDWPPNCQRSADAQEIEIVFKKKNRGIWKTYGTFSASNEKVEPAKRTYNEYEVLENTPLCKVVHLLVLRAQNYIQLVPPGRHVEVKMDVMGTEVSRPYTPVPGWLHPEDRPISFEDGCLCLMVKRYEDGAISPRLVGLQPGQSIQLSSSLGDFRPVKYDEGCEKLHMLAAGTGLTAMLPIVKRALARRKGPNVNLINFNRNEDFIFYARQLERLAAERKLTVTHILSEPEEGSWTGRTGRVSAELLRELMGERSARGCVFTCGPPGFMKAAAESLQNLGWQASQMHEFDG